MRLEDEIIAVSDGTEALLKALPRLSLAEKVDIAARLRGALKNLDKLDTDIKAEIKAQRKGKEGYVMGDVFKAHLLIVPTTRFDTGGFKEANPKLYEKWCNTEPTQRVLFESR